MGAEAEHTQTSDRQPCPTARAWLVVCLGLAAVGWGANQFAPLMLMYPGQLGVSMTIVQASYGLYAVGLIPALLVAGRLSDRYGRRRVLLPALITSVIGSLLLIIGGGTGPAGLIIGRLVSGIASGLAFGAGTAWVAELSAPRSPSDPNPGARRATVAMTAGFAGGPLVAGLLARWAPVPTFSAYLPHLTLAVIAVLWLGALRTPESEHAVRTGRSPRLSQAGSRHFRSVVLPLAPWVFGASSIALAYLPGFLRERQGEDALVSGAVITAATMLAGIVVQPLARRVYRPSGPGLLVLALGTVVLGLLLGAIAVQVAQPWPIAVASLVLGAGYGCCLVGGLIQVQRLAGPNNLGRLTAAYQAAAYSGFVAPYLLAVLEAVASASALLLTAGLAAAATLGWIVVRSRGT